MTNIFHVDFYPKDFMLDTQRQTNEQRGAYIQIISAMMAHNGAIDDDNKWLSNLCNCSVRKFDTLKKELVKGEFISISDGKIYQKRALEEVEKAQKRSEKATKNARKRHEKPPKTSGKSDENEPEFNENNNLGSASHQLPDTRHKDTDVSSPHTPQKDLMDDWNNLCGESNGRVLKLTAARTTTLKNRMADSFGNDREQWLAFLAKVQQSPFLTGDNDRGWKADFDWALKLGNTTKILEGKYDENISGNTGKHGNSGQRTGSQNQRGAFTAARAGLPSIDDQVQDLVSTLGSGANNTDTGNGRERTGSGDLPNERLLENTKPVWGEDEQLQQSGECDVESVEGLSH